MVIIVIEIRCPLKLLFVIIIMINTIHVISMPAENCTGQGRLLAAKPELNIWNYFPRAFLIFTSFLPGVRPASP